MKTEDLIARLATDPVRPGAGPGALLALAIAGALLAVAAAFFGLIGPRPDFGVALQTWRFDYKFLVTLALATSGAAVLFPLLYPESRADLRLLLIAPGLMGLSVLIELATLPASAWAMSAIGKNMLLCLTIVPALGTVPLLLMLLVIRAGASTRPGWAGFAAGIVSGGLAATFYAANCTDDSPLFVATWYPIAILALGVAGAAAGKLVARW